MNGEDFFLPQMLIGMSHAMTLGCIFDIQMGAYIGKKRQRMSIVPTITVRYSAMQGSEKV